MKFSRSAIVHREVIELEATPEQVREFIVTPERILDYYPGPIEGGIIEAGSAIYCRGKSGVSLLEIDHSASDDRVLVVKVSTASKLAPPYTAERIRSASFFTMIEDWELEPIERGTRLGKTWRDITQRKMKFLPMRWIVRRGAKAETTELKAAWERAAKSGQS